MTQPSSKVQQALSNALLRTLRSPDLSHEDSEWIQQFAIRTITEFNLAHEENEAPEQPRVALDRFVG
jgi:hypothetical protein